MYDNVWCRNMDSEESTIEEVGCGRNEDVWWLDNNRDDLSESELSA